MSDHIRRTIDDLQRKLRSQELEVEKTKQLINLLCEEAGLDPIYELSESSPDSLFSLRSDQFYGRPLATVIREYLKMRRAASKGAAMVNEIYDALRRGGYHFQAKSDENAKRGLQISLSKNPIFHRIPGGAWGLSEWYPTAKAGKDGNGKRDIEDTDEKDELSSQADDQLREVGADDVPKGEARRRSI